MIVHNRLQLARPIRSGLLILVGVVASTACSASDKKAPPRFTVTDFSRLGWLAGDWQSRTPDGRSIYDRYRVIDDSTMQYTTFSDAAFRIQKDSAVIGLRGGLVIDRANGAPWFATCIDTASANFESQASPANHFVWTRVSRDHWTTQIFSTDPKGTETRTVFQVERVKGK